MQRKRVLTYGLVAFMFFIAGLVLYAGALASYFHADDYEIIRAVERDPFGIWSGRGDIFFRPMISLITYLDYLVWGLNPFGYHLTNVLYHIAVSMLLTWVLCRVLTWVGVRTLQASVASVTAGLIFLTMPVHGESVTWIAGRTDVIAVFLALVSVASYVEYRFFGRHLSWLGFSFVSAFASLLAKEATLGLPLMIMGAELVLRTTRGTPGRWYWTVTGFTAVLVSYLLLRASLLGVLVGGYDGASAVYRWHLLPEYVYRSLLDVLFHTGILQRMGTVIPSLLLAAAIGLFVVVNYARRTLLLLIVGVLVFYVLALVPMQSLLHTQLIYYPVGDRLLYFPSVFAAALVSLLFVFSGERLWRYIAVIGILLIGWNSFALHEINHVWWQAGVQQQQIIADFAQHDLESAPAHIVLNAPASYQWSYMFPNGVESAFYLNGAQTAQQRTFLVSMHGQIPYAPSIAVSTAENSTLSVSLPQGVWFLTEVERRPIGYEPYYEYVGCCDAVSIALTEAGEALPVFYYTDGRLRRLQ